MSESLAAKIKLAVCEPPAAVGQRVETDGNTKYAYVDCRKWPDEERWELIDGAAHDMSPAPALDHQLILVALARFFAEHFEGKMCRVLAAPFDVLLPSQEEQPDDHVKTVVQPDLFVVCDARKLDSKKCRGAPDLVVEIISPSTAGKDSLTKLNLYEKNGVKEYWLVHPIDRLLTIFSLQSDGRYGRPDVHAATETAVAGVLFPDLVIDLTRVFPKNPFSQSV